MKPPMPDYDFIIIGQGLAGSLLAWRLMQQNCTVLVIDNADKAAASQIAAGLINPVTGIRLGMHEKTGSYLQQAKAYYRELEQAFDQTLLHQKDMLRVIRNDQELQAWQGRCKDKRFQPYLSCEMQAAIHKHIIAPQGAFLQHETGYLDTRGLLRKVKDSLVKQNSFIQKNIQYTDIRIMNNQVSIDNISANKLIFCEGYQSINNPWFSWLPFAPAKGDILSMRATEKLPQQIVNNGSWLLPLDDYTFRFGATYEHEFTDTEPGTNNCKKLLKQLDVIYKQAESAQVVKHEAGIRPCTRDREPFIGLHPQLDQIGIFNGFGSKGSLLIPYYANQFTQALLSNKTIDSNANINRYWNNNAQNSIG